MHGLWRQSEGAVQPLQERDLGPGCLAIGEYGGNGRACDGLSGIEGEASDAPQGAATLGAIAQGPHEGF